MANAWWMGWVAAALLGAEPAIGAEPSPGDAPKAAAVADDAAVEFYEKRIRPILAANCYECHGDDQQESGLQVTSVAAMLRGGDQGPAMVPGDAEASLLMKGVRWEDGNFQMPPKAKLSTDQIATLEQWINDGALGPDESRASAAGAKKFDLAERAKHWCFQPIGSPAIPVVFDAAWSRSPIDQFILAKLESANLRPAPEADPQTLLRRVYFDLIGLPPPPLSQSVVEDAKKAGDADRYYEELVDRLLASEHFGERWARHWLDLVRYAETRGHEFDPLIPNAYQYRDYVIRALNADVPYDRFVGEHIAGDLLPTPRTNPTTGANESILGTGFWWLGEEVHSPVDIRQDETDRVDNKIDVLSKTFLGLTLACARCHDHKFDALTTKDYYALSGFALSMSYRQAAFETEAHNRRIYDEVKKLEAEHRRTLLDAQYELWRPVLKNADKYLSATEEASRELAGKKGATTRAAVVAALANEYELDEKRLTAWIEQSEHLEALRPRSNDQVVARDESAAVPPSSLGGPPADWRIIYDASAVAPQDWFADGLAFGAEPRRRGEVQIGTDPGRPIHQVHLTSLAAVDRKWDLVRPSGDAEREAQRIDWQQLGRTLKTPTFRLDTGRLAYLVRGSVQVYAAVDSHRINRGPLHGALVKKFAGDDGLRWVEHDLSAYRGERVHLEFSPYELDDLKKGQSPECGVRGVIERPDTPNPLAGWFFDEPLFFADALALAFSPKPEKTFQDAAAALRDSATGPPMTAFQVVIANEMLRRPEMWNTSSNEVAAKVAPFFEKQAALLAQIKPVSHTAPCAWEGSGVDEHVLVRGQHKSPGDLVPRRFLEALDGPTAPKYETASGRLDLAERIVDEKNPLAARVIVNRVWHHLFGRGIVRTVDNFGIMGETPTHPELLDHLAQEFMNDGWSVKRLIRRLVLSSTYRQAGGQWLVASGQAEVDPKNDLFHRANVKRLDAEVIRDALLAVSGRLDKTMLGPSVEVHLTSFMEGRGRPGKSGPLDGDGRRSIYLRVRRNFLNPMFQAFDYPTPFTAIGRRTSSNVPAQALSLLNGELVNQQAAHWATRVLREVPGDDDARIDRLYREAFARPPTNDELTAAREFLVEQAKSYDSKNADDPRVWTDLCHVLFNVKEFIYIP